MKILYEKANQFDEGFLKVSEIHNLYYAQYGNPKGKPVVFLHGGPGGGCIPVASQYFDPQFYRVVLFDQRGAGKSTPLCEMKENTSGNLIEDIEKLRAHLNIGKWMVFGGSWGSTLSLIYSIAHPDKIVSIILRGIFLGTQKEIDWIYEEGGASKFFPEAFERYQNFIPVQERDNLVKAYGKRLFGEDKKTALEAAHQWSRWESALVKLFPSVYSMTDEEALAMAKAECHYFLHKCFFKEDDYILNNCSKIEHIPCTIVQGRYDMDCPPFSAYKLHKKLPKSVLNIVTFGGHSSMEPGLIDGLVTAAEVHKRYFL